MSEEQKVDDGFEGGQDVQSSWFKFEKVGDFIKGTLMSKRYQKSNDPKFADQWLYEVRAMVGISNGQKLKEGVVYTVGISIKKAGTLQRLNICQPGEIIGIKFDKEGDQTEQQKKQKMAPAKYLVVKTWGTDPKYSEMDGGQEVSGDANAEEIPM